MQDTESPAPILAPIIEKCKATRRHSGLLKELTQVTVTSDLLAKRRHVATISCRFYRLAMPNKVTVTLLALKHRKALAGILLMAGPVL
jgi:hypothetical protein